MLPKTNGKNPTRWWLRNHPETNKLTGKPWWLEEDILYFPRFFRSWRNFLVTVLGDRFFRGENGFLPWKKLRSNAGPVESKTNQQDALLMLSGYLARVQESIRPLKETTRRWWQLKYFLFSPRFCGEMIQFDWYFSGGLKPPTRRVGFFKIVLVDFLNPDPWGHSIQFAGNSRLKLPEMLRPFWRNYPPKRTLFFSPLWVENAEWHLHLWVILNGKFPWV